MNRMAVLDDPAYAEGWTAMTRTILQHPPDTREVAALDVIRYLTATPPRDAFDLGALHAAEVGFGG